MSQEVIENYERQRNRRILQAALGLAAVALLVVVNILYTNYSQRQNDRRWCELVTGLDNRYQALKEPTPEAVEFRDIVNRLQRSLPCKEN